MKTHSSEDKATEITLFYTYEKDLYAFSENPDLVMNFELTRDMGKFYVKKAFVDEDEYRVLLVNYKQQMLLNNVLYDGKRDFEIATTYKEDFELGRMCDKLYDEVLDLERVLLITPFSMRVRESIGDLVALRKKPRGYSGNFNTFNVFMMMYGELFLKLDNRSNQSII